MIRQELIAEYATFKQAHDRAPNPYSVPNEREEAGYWLQYSAPLHAFDACRASGAWWDRVRWIIVETLADECQAQAQAFLAKIGGAR